MMDKRIELKIPAELLAEIDEAAAKGWQSRSDYIRESIVLRLNKQTIVDEPDPDRLWQEELARIANLAPEAG